MESLWQIRSWFQQRFRRAGGDSRQFQQSRRAGGDSRQFRQSRRVGGDSRQFQQSRRAGEGGWQSAHPLARTMVEILFWSVTTLIISMFLYYCAWGKLSVHAGLDFHGSFVVEKNVLCYNQTWENRRSKEFKNNSQVIDMEEARARRQQKDVQRKEKRKKRSRAPNSRTPEASEPSAEARPGEK